MFNIQYNNYKDSENKVYNKVKIYFLIFLLTTTITTHLNT
jgi:hypothetical protein